MLEVVSSIPKSTNNGQRLTGKKDQRLKKWLCRAFGNRKVDEAFAPGS